MSRKKIKVVWLWLVPVAIWLMVALAFAPRIGRWIGRR
jgi:hypothetical protein